VVEKEITKSTKSLGLSQPKGDQKAANWETLVGAEAAAGLSAPPALNVVEFYWSERRWRWRWLWLGMFDALV